MGQPSRDHPGSRSRNVEKLCFAFPPGRLGAPKRGETSSTVFRVPSHEFQPRFFFRQRRRSDVDIEHRSEPEILTDTLMHHVFMDTTAARIGLIGARGQVLVTEHAPHAEHLHALCFIHVDQKVISHSGPPGATKLRLGGDHQDIAYLADFAAARQSPRYATACSRGTPAAIGRKHMYRKIALALTDAADESWATAAVLGIGKFGRPGAGRGPAANRPPHQR